MAKDLLKALLEHDMNKVYEIIYYKHFDDDARKTLSFENFKKLMEDKPKK